MTELPIITSLDGKPLVDSRTIAWECGLQHRSAFRMIVQFQDELESELGTVRFENAPSKARGGGGDGQRYALLTEIQAAALITLFRNTLPVVRFKIRLAKAFDVARRIIRANRHKVSHPHGENGAFVPKYPLDRLLEVMKNEDWSYNDLCREAIRVTGMSVATVKRKIKEARQAGRVINAPLLRRAA